MPHLQLTFELDSSGADALEAACSAAGALSATLSDAGNAPILEPEPCATPLWPKVRMAALFAASADRARILDSLNNALDSLPSQYTFTQIADRVWEREWLADFRPMRFGTRLWVCPGEAARQCRQSCGSSVGPRPFVVPDSSEALLESSIP